MSSADREIITTRLFPVRRERVFAAWTDPNVLSLWWGPKGFRNSFSEFDLRPGGYWRFIMSGPDGADYRNESRFVEIIPDQRIIFDHCSGHRFRVIAEFEERNDGTLLRWSMVFESQEDYDHIRSYIIDANEQNLDRLQTLLSPTQ